MSSSSGFARVTRPTMPSASSICSASTRLPSTPESPTACAPAAINAATSSWFTLPASTFSTASMVSAVVTRIPFTNLLAKQRSARYRVICLPPPWTTAIWLPRCAFGEIVDGAHHYGAARRLVDRHADVAEIGALHGAQIGSVSRLVKADKRLSGVTFLIDRKDVFRGRAFDRAEVDGFQNPAVERQQLRRKAEFALL